MDTNEPNRPPLFPTGSSKRGWRESTPPLTPAELEAANRELLRKRKALGLGQPRPVIGQTADRALLAQPIDQAIWENWINSRPEPGVIQTSRARWDAFNSDRHPDLKRAVKTIARWYNEEMATGRGLILAGNPGCGKSHLAEAIYQMVGAIDAVYLNELDLVASVQAGYGHKSGGKTLEEIAVKAWRAQLLIYDDLGAYETDNKAWLRNIYYSLFNGRYDERKAVLITTNIRLTAKSDSLVWSPIEELLGSRIYSRLMGQIGTLDHYLDLFKVPDYRLRNI